MSRGIAADPLDSEAGTIPNTEQGFDCSQYREAMSFTKPPQVVSSTIAMRICSIAR